MPFSFFIKTKDLLVDELIPWIKDLKATYGLSIKIIRCDNAGENVKLQETCKNEGLGIHFEYTALGTPQQNGGVKHRFQTLYGRVRDVLSGSRLTKATRTFLWPEAATTATDLDAILIKDVSGVNSFTKLFGEGNEISPVSILPEKFGETVIVSDRSTIKAT